MRIRFRHTTPSDRPEYPFQAGQIIEVSTLTAALRTALKPLPDGSVAAELLPDNDGLVAATVAAPERAVLGKAKGRTA